MTVNYREQYAKYNKYFTSLRLVYTKKPEVRVSLNLLMTLLAISFFGLFALRSTISTIAELLSNVKSQEEISNKLDEKIQALQKAHANWTQEAQREFLIDQALPKGPQPDDYLRQIEGLSAQTSVTLIALTLQDVLIYGKGGISADQNADKDSSGPVKYMNVTFTVEGQYSQVISFENGLENLRRNIKIDTLSLGQAKKQTNNITLTIAGKVPYLDSQK